MLPSNLFVEVLKCNSAGTALEPIKVCQSDELCRLTANGAECYTPSDGGDTGGSSGECAWYDIPCKIDNFFNDFKVVFAIIAGFLGGLTAAFMTRKPTEGLQGKYRLVIALVVFLVIGGALAYLAFSYFWLVMGLLVVLGLIKWLVPGI